MPSPLQISEFNSPSYVTAEPVVQKKGIDPVSQKVMAYKIDQNGAIIARYDETSKTWKTTKSSGPYQYPSSFEDLISQADADQGMTDLLSSGIVKAKTGYMIFGDEPVGGAGVVDLRSRMSAEDLDAIKKLFVFMPRRYLREWYMKEVYPNLPSGSSRAATIDVYTGQYTQNKSSDNMVWAAFIDLFNEANLAYIVENHKEPWAWEEEKLDNYLIGETKAASDVVTEKLRAYEEQVLGIDPKAQKLMKDYETLPKLGDQGLEISRQFAISELLKKKDYSTVQGIIDAYRYSDQTILGEALTKPVPFDIVSSDGTIVKATPQP